MTDRQSPATTAAHIDGTRARRIGRRHAAGNVAVLVLFALSLLLRSRSGDWGPSGLAIALSFAGLAMAGLSSWLGGELVERLEVGVDDEAGANAPRSLRSSSARPASAR